MDISCIYYTGHKVHVSGDPQKRSDQDLVYLDVGKVYKKIDEG
jgi:hypothetical protein